MRRSRVAAVSALTLIAIGLVALTAISTAGGGSGSDSASGAPSGSEQGRELIREGTALNERGRHRKAAEVLRGGLKELDGQAPQRLLARASFQLGLALRGSARFPAAREALNRSRLLGADASAVGRQLDKVLAGERR